ncbi:MAG: hypothetical protein JWM05_1146, partial [Acidimicrobiales bacterium]|nr:hypothetical protein [Acidimicrobiales bacterium]
ALAATAALVVGVGGAALLAFTRPPRTN